jgi:hypothetical protein
VSDSPIERPRFSPDLSKLSWDISHDPETGEEIGHYPWIGWRECEDATDDFVQFVTHVDKLLAEKHIKKENWRFADTALNFLEKAFLSENEEQLLWHITTIEAILGEKIDSGLTEMLAGRVSRILGRTTEEAKRIRKNFKTLYALRSDLVHGNADLSDREIYYGHLGQAREMARALTVWMLEYLKHIAKSLPGESELPSRQAILAAIDLDEKSRSLASVLLASLPKDFPKTEAWAESKVKSS